MDVRFLRDISEAYVIDTNSTLDVDSVFNELYELVKFIRETDVYLYEELYAVDRLYQQRILTNYLNLTFFDDEALLNEISGVEVVLSAGVLKFLLAAIVAAIWRRPISRGIFKTISDIGTLLNSIGKWFQRRGQYMRLRYAIIQQNFQRCYTECKISDIRQISALSYLAITTRSVIGTKLSLEQAGCLRECYIENLVEIICLHMESYFACLKRTGAYNVIDKTDSDELLKMISSTNISSVCEDHYRVAKETFEKFYQVLDLVYNSPNDDSRRLEWVQRLRSRLYEIREQIRRTDNQTLQQRYSSGSDQQNRPQNQNQQNRPQYQNR